ncbi:MAG: SMC-Scp complex subunit ScpB [Deltaproteobacteria bacterium]|nr:SMC-Scp complex subunit ScpB [Deltaproteobacteria bacterium]
MLDNLKPIIESLIFVADEPLSIKQLEAVLGGVSRQQIKDVLKRLMAEYETEKRGFALQEVAGGYQFRTRPEYRDWVIKLKQSSPAKLSRAALETLAIIAYKQPVLRTDVEHLRGVDSGGIFKTLLERDLIRVLGRKDLPGRPMVYGTTRRFLEVFGLKDLSSLPTLEEMEQLEESWPSVSKSS